jgi:hypothetical protein
MYQLFTTTICLLLRRTLVRSVILITKITGLATALNHFLMIKQGGMTNKSVHCFNHSNYCGCKDSDDACMCSPELLNDAVCDTTKADSSYLPAT